MFTILAAERDSQKRGKTMGKRSFWQSLRNNKWLVSTGMLAAGALAVYGVWQIPSLNQYHMETLESPATGGEQNGNTENTNTDADTNANTNTQKNQGNSGFDLPRDTEEGNNQEKQQEAQEGTQEEQNQENQQGTLKQEESEQGENTSKQSTSKQNASGQQGKAGSSLQETAESTASHNTLTEQQKKTEEGKKKKEEKAEQDFVEASSNPQTILNEGSFDESAGLSWPIQGDVILNYDTEGVVYFQTLAQYKANPAIMIAGTEGKKVKASAAGIVTEIAKNEETGVTLKMSVGNSYEILYGQLQDLKVCEGDQIKEGTVLGTLAEPTDYYIVEGPNLYFQILQDGTPVNPLLLLK